MTTNRGEPNIVDKHRLTYYATKRIDTNIGRTGVSFGGYVVGVSIGVGVGAAIAGYAVGTIMVHLMAFIVYGAAAYPEEVRVFAWPLAALFGGLGLALAFPRQVRNWNDLVTVRIEHEYEPTVETEARTGERTNKLHVVVKSADGRYAEFDQPEAGSFSRLLRYSLNDEPAVLKLRTARDFGWPDEQYRLVVQELRHIGWLHATETINKSPIFTEAGKTEANNWLRR